MEKLGYRASYSRETVITGHLAYLSFQHLGIVGSEHPAGLTPLTQPVPSKENQTRRKYLERIRRLCLLMIRMAEEDDSDGMNKRELYRELFFSSANC